jgi:hypothetical protein
VYKGIEYSQEYRDFEQRWRHKTKSQVIHPERGTAIVPHGSNLSALMCAAEYWGCTFQDIVKDARVMYVEKDAVVVPRPPFANYAG